MYVFYFIFVGDQIHVRGQDSITELSTILNFVSDIHLARHVDVDGVLMDGSFSTNEIYANTVEKGRLLVRTLEASLQGAYDDGMALLMTTQSISTSEFGQNRHKTYECLDNLCLSLKSNMDLFQQTLETLLAIGHEQADTAQGEYNGSIEWRLSKVSTIHQDAISTGYASEDVVDMEYAMNRRNTIVLPLVLANQPEIQTTRPDEALHSDQSSIDPNKGTSSTVPSPGPDDESEHFLENFLACEVYLREMDSCKQVSAAAECRKWQVNQDFGRRVCGQIGQRFSAMVPASKL